MTFFFLKVLRICKYYPREISHSVTKVPLKNPLQLRATTESEALLFKKRSQLLGGTLVFLLLRFVINNVVLLNKNNKAAFAFPVVTDLPNTIRVCVMCNETPCDWTLRINLFTHLF